MELDPDTIRLAKGTNLATVVTLMPDGQPQALPTWVDTDGSYLLINTEPQRQRARNLRRDPRITLLIQSAEDVWDWSEVRGTVVETIGGQPARDHIDELSLRYDGVPFSSVGPEGRIILKVAPTKVNTPVSLGKR
jgi:PPOX class probable F420-dependent enzyme